ncbi:uncharacterized protein [Amphiura filiformis]|uniref:uncharacterized protein isoform X1 n=1 Tax=Amphiura filiformis TaxID=82378 RepID=UPI003B21CCF0
MKVALLFGLLVLAVVCQAEWDDDNQDLDELREFDENDLDELREFDENDLDELREFDENLLSKRAKKCKDTSAKLCSQYAKYCNDGTIGYMAQKKCPDTCGMC